MATFIYPATLADGPRFLSRRQVAMMFGVSVSTVTRWAQRGLLKTVRTPGGHYRFPIEETRRAAGELPKEELIP